MTLNIVPIPMGDSAYPAALQHHLAGVTPDCVFALGNLKILEEKLLALFCSVQCPGNLILKTYDLARDLRDAGITVISGFHSPMEKECLSILLRGKQPVVWCLAKRLTIQGVPKEYLQPLEEGRLLILSPFGEKVGRATQQTALLRNEVVAALAERVFVSFAAPGSKTESFCRQVLDWRKPLWSFDDAEIAALRDQGVRPFRGVTSMTGNHH